MAEELVSSSPSAKLKDGVLGRIEQSINEREEDEDFRDRLLQAHSFRLSRANVMKIQRRHETFNLEDDYWKTDLLMRLDAGFKAIRLLQDEPGYALPTSAPELRVEYLGCNRSLWTEEGLDHPVVEQSTEQDWGAYLKNQMLLDNGMYKPQGNAEACAALGIANPLIPQFPSMATTIHFKFWQVVAIREMLK